MLRSLLISLPVLLQVALLALQANAEPYLAVHSQQACSQCHVNPTGGGLRTQYGSIYAQTSLAAKPGKNPSEAITSLFGKGLMLGANARGSARIADIDGQDDAGSFETDRVTLYLAAEVNEHVTLYLDQKMAPGGALNREAWLMLRSGGWYLKAGKMFLPYGWRLEDDSAFIRETTGVNFNSSDNGFEIGLQRRQWHIQVSLTNGSAGAAELNDGKQGSLRGEYVGGSWRLGVSANYNNGDIADRSMYGLFAGLHTGDIAWLLEWDRIEDMTRGQPDNQLDATLLEANYAFRQGHNLKFTLESLVPDNDSEEDIYRGSVVWEYSPWSFTQLRAGYRHFDSDDEQPINNREEAFLQLHVFF